jgi:hypothetical protein
MIHGKVISPLAVVSDHTTYVGKSQEENSCFTELFGNVRFCILYVL